MISHNHKCIFIHIPKVAGTSVEEILGLYNNKCFNGWDKERNLWLQHATCHELLSYNIVEKQTFNNYFKFTFVRNPWDRAVSEYRWRLKLDNYFSWFLLPQNKYRNAVIKKLRKKLYIPKISFKEYLLLKDDHICEDKSKKYKSEWIQHQKSQCDYVFDKNKNLLVDFVGRFERIGEDWQKLSKILEIKDILPHYNISGQGNYTKYYDDESQNLIAKKYKDDIEFFGYEFGK